MFLHKKTAKFLFLIAVLKFPKLAVDGGEPM